MDFIYIGLTVALIVLSIGFIHFCGKL